ncbi:outer membrane beta-barrel domain-containing protein [Archangium lipolyticum]|uniref:outer membrane beta-barrel domain-containing protein n=1 Tax=Archangium lipolyticum TaxID=2970465 RepID=UPI00214A4860|nr:outer membrane beta-barrel domain-containing protein [Archangium lipolyticum]
MNARTLPLSASLALLLTAMSAQAQQQVLDPAAVRHRLFSPEEHLEVSISVGLPVREYLTAHYNLNVGVAYNLFNTFGLEARAGYALSRHTGLARSISESFLNREDKKITDELEDMWQMNLHGVVGARWAPIYGKLSLLADETAHFQAYLWGGGGLASLRRQSVIQCTNVQNRELGICDNRTDPLDASTAKENYWRTETRMAPVVSGAVGFRFFVASGHAIRFELRDWVYTDQYRVNVVREDWEAGRESGEPARDPGLTHLVQFDLGYTFIF